MPHYFGWHLEFFSDQVKYFFTFTLGNFVLPIVSRTSTACDPPETIVHFALGVTKLPMRQCECDEIYSCSPERIAYDLVAAGPEKIIPQKRIVCILQKMS